MKITGSVVTYNNDKTIERCLRSVLKETADKDYEFELYVYDNGSSDKTVSIIEEQFPQVILVKDTENKGFGAGHNAILKRVKSDYHFVINPDIYLDMDTIGGLTAYLEEHREAGLITPRILNNDGTEQSLPKYCPTIRYVIISKFFKVYREHKNIKY